MNVKIKVLTGEWLNPNGTNKVITETIISDEPHDIIMKKYKEKYPDWIHIETEEIE
jgi:hypothetical protein